MKLLLFLLCSLPYFLMAQDYYPPKKENISQSQYSRNIKVLEETYANDFVDKNIITSLCYARLGEDETTVFAEAEKGLEVAPQATCDIIQLISTRGSSGPIVFQKINKKRWKNICDFCDSLNGVVQVKTVVSPLNHELIRVLDTLKANDQKMRSQEVTISSYSDEFKAHWKKQDRLDSLNQIKVRAIINEFGYPGTTLVGAAYSDIVITIIRRGSLETQESYLPSILKAHQEEEISSGLVHLLIDDIHVAKDGKQVFGTQKKWDERLNKIVLVPFYSYDKIVEIKKEYGLK